MRADEVERLSFPNQTVPAYIIGRFERVDSNEWQGTDNNTKARIGKDRFLELAGALDATPERVRQWLREKGPTPTRADWRKVTIAPELVRYVNFAFTTRCVDAFLTSGRGGLQGCELKVSGKDGVCGLTVNEEKLIRGEHIRVFAVNPIKGLMGEMDAEALLAVPRRVDGIPVGEARVEWIDPSNQRP